MASQSPLIYDPDLDVLTQRAADLMWNVYPGYSAERFGLDELIPSVRGNLAMAVEVLRRDRRPSSQELAPARALGSRRAGQSVPLESVIQAYRSTERVILLDLFSDTRNWPVHQASHHADLVLTTFDLLTDEMINVYRETASAIEATRRRTENEVVHALTSGHPVPVTEFQEWCRLLKIDPEARWFAFALRSGADADPLDLQRLSRKLAAQLQPHAAQVLFGDVGQAVVALVALRDASAQPRHVLGEVLSTVQEEIKIFCGIGQFSPALATAGESCRQAIEATRAAAAGTSATGASILDYDDVLVEILLAGRPTVADSLVETRVGPLAGHPHLMETLEALVANNLSQSEVARQLFVHVNTVNHRVKRIREITGMDITKLADAVELALALRWLKLTT